jgi:D-cysteine desulfhydrase
MEVNGQFLPPPTLRSVEVRVSLPGLDESMRYLNEIITEPDRLSLATTPTRIEKLKGDYHGVNIYIKRDDETGFELSGNKIRKLEYALKEAISTGCDAVITCGGIQTNHGRATVIAAVKLGLKPYLVLKSDETDVFNGNYLLDELYGAQIIKITPQQYSDERNQIMESLKEELKEKGIHAYVIPEGASNGLGNFGYMRAVEEIIAQEEASGIRFDTIVAAMGSGGTHTGLYLGTKILGRNHHILGFNIYDKTVNGTQKIYDLAMQSVVYADVERFICMDDIDVINDYVGRGYALNTEEELEWIKDFIKHEGVLLDTVYTGKAMRGLVMEIEAGRFKEGDNILFIHTGGGFGNFSKVKVLFK